VISPPVFFFRSALHVESSLPFSEHYRRIFSDGESGTTLISGSVYLHVVLSLVFVLFLPQRKGISRSFPARLCPHDKLSFARTSTWILKFALLLVVGSVLYELLALASHGLCFPEPPHFARSRASAPPSLAPLLSYPLFRAFFLAHVSEISSSQVPIALPNFSWIPVDLLFQPYSLSRPRRGSPPPRSSPQDVSKEDF